jgi:aryl-alcohol dehydrogenase-like predicted oxidoreductase
MEDKLNPDTKVSARAAGTVSLGGELIVNRMGFGAMRLTGDGIWGPPKDRAAAVAVVRRAVELGVNFIDTADSYGPNVSEEIIAEALAPYPKNLVIASKGGWKRSGPGQWLHDSSPDHLREAVEGSLKRLRVERLDLYFLHAPDHEVSFDASVEALAELRAQAKIRLIGLSNVTREHIERARKIVPVVSVQNRYNFADREWDYVLQYCEQNKLVFIPWRPIGSGNVSYPIVVRIAEAHRATPTQVALAWLLDRSPIVLPIPGTSSIQHLEENVGAGLLELSDEERAELSSVKKKFTKRGV